MAASHFMDEISSRASFSALAERVSKMLPEPLAPSAADAPAQATEASPTTESTEQDARLAPLIELCKENPDLVGWIRIEGTSVDYPVMQTPSDPEFYLSHDFTRGQSKSGTPFLDHRSDPAQPAPRSVIYGHHMKSGAMFASLARYEDKEFLDRHRLIRFDTIHGAGDYEVMAVVKYSAASGDFGLENFLEDNGEAAFNAFVRSATENSLYETGVAASLGDSLLCLATCEYSQYDGRILIVAKKMATPPVSR
jgi:sortase B